MTRSSPRDPAVHAVAVHLSAETLGEAIVAAHLAGDGGATFGGLEERSGYKKQHIHEWTQPLSGREAKIAHLVELGPRIGITFCELLAAKLRARIERVACDLRHLALGAVSSSGQLANEVRKAFADERLEADEITQIEAAALRLQADAVAVLAECARARSELGGRKGAPR